MKDIHLARGMQCVDCHFLNDSHGNGLLHVEPRAATAITCVDCHGTVSKHTTLVTSGKGGKELAHSNDEMDCQTCHTAWATSCFGCHIPMEANSKMAANKFEGTTTRNFSSYNPQVVRDDVFMLGKDSTAKDHRLSVLRSSSAMVVGSQGANREWFYTQQQTVSAEGYSGQAFNPHFAHTTSGVGTTKNCTDCHLSEANDNNAIMTQLLGFGTGTVNFFGRFSYVGTDKHGLHGVAWTERT
jgi:Cytochrome c3